MARLDGAGFTSSLLSAGFFVPRDVLTGVLIASGCTGAYLLVALLTGTKPGGPGLRF